MEDNEDVNVPRYFKQKVRKEAQIKNEKSDNS